MESVELEFTGERIVGKTLEEVAACCPPEGQRHIDRYMWAKERIRGEKILDCACGCGFGSFILSESDKVGYVFGLDIDISARDYAMQYYGNNSKTIFSQCDMLDLVHISSAHFDSIVSLESLEHVEDPTIVLNQFKRLLKPGGNIIASLPIIPTKHFNPYHKFEVRTFDEGRLFFDQNGFKIVDSWLQDEMFGIYELEVA